MRFVQTGLHYALCVITAFVLSACSESSTGTGGGGGGGTADTLVRLTDNLYDRNHPCWNSTGTEIYFTKYVVTQPGNVLTSNIWSIPATGGQETQHTFFTGFTDFPSVKPALLAFRSDHDGYFDIYTSNGGLLNVTNTEAKDFEVAVTPPDASGKLAFSKADSLGGGVVWNIYTLESTGLEKISTGNKDFHPTFSDRGNYIAFQRTHGEFDGAQVIVIPRYGGQEVEVTLYGLSCQYPDWNRAYDKIAFCRGGKVFMRDPDGSNEKQLTFNTQFAQYPAWSPNGQKLAYVEFTEGHYVIFVKDVKHILTAP